MTKEIQGIETLTVISRPVAFALIPVTKEPTALARIDSKPLNGLTFDSLAKRTRIPP